MIVADLRLEVAAGSGLVARWGGVVLVMSGPLDGQGCAEVLEIARHGAAEGVDGRALAYRLGAFMGEAGPDGVPSYAVLADATAEGGRPVVVLHGAARVHATGSDVDETLVGTDRPTWVDDYLPTGVDRIEIGPAGAELPGAGTSFDLVEGAVPGSGAVLVTRGARVVAAAEPEDAESEAPPPAPAEEVAAEPAEPGEEPSFRHIALTPITDEEARAPLPLAGRDAAEADGDDATGGVLVDGVRCIRSHFNHPVARYCAHCGIGMVQQTHQLTQGVRPPLGILVFDDGATLSLDASYVIGRDPSRDADVAAGKARPFVLDDPDQVLSRVHAEVRLTGWDVELVDRDSANGTYVAAGDGEWERIEPGTPFTMQPGTQARVGRQEFVFESHHRRS